MSSLDFDPETAMNELAFEWRQGYQASIVARAEYQALMASPQANEGLLQAALERLDRSEVLKARIMAKIERLEDHMLSHE
jgi:hypothetical protein